MTPASRERWQVQLPVYFFTLIAWAGMVYGSGASAPGDSCCAPVASAAVISSGHLKKASIHLIGRAAFNWAVMLVAMMGPMLAMPIRYIIDRSFAWRRGRGVTLFLAGYFGVWMAAGALMLAVATALPRGIATSATFVGIIVASAIAWQCSPFKQRCLNRGHSHAALAAFGRAADVDSLRVGLVHGGWCLGSCWSLMLIPYAFPAYHLTAMAVLTMWILAERLENPAPPIWRMRAPARAVRIVMVRVQMSYQSLSPINASSWKCSTQRPPVGPPERSPVG